MGMGDEGLSILCGDRDEIMADAASKGVPQEIGAMVAYTRQMLDEDWLERATVQELLCKLVQELLFYASVHDLDLHSLADVLADMVHTCCVEDGDTQQ